MPREGDASSADRNAAPKPPYRAIKRFFVVQEGEPHQTQQKTRLGGFWWLLFAGLRAYSAR